MKAASAFPASVQALVAFASEAASVTSSVIADGAGFHRNGGPSARRIAHELVARLFAEMGTRDVADIIEVEGDDGTEPGMVDRVLCALTAFLEQAVVIDTLLSILARRAPGRGRLRAIVFHCVVLAVPQGRLRLHWR